MGLSYDGLGFRSLLTSGDNNAKTAKSNASLEYFTVIQHFSHASTSGFNVCASASPGCIKTCLDEAGRGQMKTVQEVRKARTKYFMLNRDSYFILLVAEIEKFKRKAEKQSKKLAVRLNGTSDIVWEKIAPWLFTNYKDVQFYDYTKHYKRCMKSYKLPSNYHLTFSRSETNDKQVSKVLRSGKCNVAVVFGDSNFPQTWKGKPVYSMDETDLRFLDPSGSNVGALYAKGGAFKKDHKGFILPTASCCG